MQGQKTFSRSALIDMCGGSEEAVKEALPWHELRDNGLWLVDGDPGLAGADLATMQWHPRKNSAVPALPVPFTACDLAAFFLAGGGLYLYERFDFEALDAEVLTTQGRDPDKPVELSQGYRDDLRNVACKATDLFEDALRSLGDNADEAREALRNAIELRRAADDRFGRDDDGVRNSANWLLNSTQPKSVSVKEIPSGAATQPVQRAAAQDAAILKCLHDFGYEPLSLPPIVPGKSGVKAAIRAALGSKGMWAGSTVFDKAWDRLSSSKSIAYRK